MIIILILVLLYDGIPQVREENLQNLHAVSYRLVILALIKLRATSNFQNRLT